MTNFAKKRTLLDSVQDDKPVSIEYFCLDFYGMTTLCIFFLTQIEQIPQIKICDNLFDPWDIFKHISHFRVLILKCIKEHISFENL
ncbi:hypothetical protein DRF69_16210 [Chryseobacterium sp. 5_R23647]|nr:hypothetical protein DRF69_16210 [Chryseobacterium sp. 5_R23647]